MGSTGSVEFMDWDLWGPAYYQVAEESESNLVAGWQHNFAGDGIDMIEENILNEICGLQVLRVLITEADAEIYKLDEYLVSLQNELAWDEHEEWSEICCSTLKHKINCLNVSLRSLRSGNEDDVGVASIIHEEPAERLHVIIKTLLRNYYPKKYEKKFLQNEQPPEGSCVKESNSDILGCGKDENAVWSAPQEECTGENSSKLPYEKSSHFEELSHQNVDYSISNAPVNKHDQNKSIMEVCKSKIEADGEAKEIRYSLTNKERSIILYSPLTVGFVRNSSREIEPTDSIIGETDTDAVRCITGLNESKRRSKPCSGTSLRGTISSNSMQEIASENSMTMTEISSTDAVVESMSLWLKTEVKRESMDKSYALDSIMEIPSQRSNGIMDLQRVKEESVAPGFVKQDHVAFNCRSILKEPLMPQKHGNSKEQSNSVNSQTSSALQIAAKALPSKSNRQRKSTNVKNCGCESSGRRKSKSSIFCIHDESSLALVATNISANSNPQPQKKRSDGLNDSSLGEVKSKASLQNMKLVDLRAIARLKKLKGYYKLPKQVLVEQIANMGA